MKACENLDLLTKIRNKITGLSGLLCYFQPPNKIGYRDGNKQSEGRGTRNLLLLTTSGGTATRWVYDNF